MARESRGFYLWRRPTTGVWYTCRAQEGRKVWRRSTGTADHAEAQRAMAAHILEYDAAAAERKDPTVGFLLDNYLAGYLLKRPNSATNAAAVDTLKAHFGKIPLREVKQSDVVKYVASRKRGRTVVTETKSGPVRRLFTAGNSTCRRELVVLTAACNWIGNAEYCRTEDGGRVRLEIELPPDSPPKDCWLRETEVDALLKAVESPAGVRMSRLCRFVWLALASMGRRGAITELRWKQVDFQTRVLHLNPPGREQTKKRRASVPIADWFLPVLERMYAERETEYVLDHPGSVYAAFKRACARAGLPANVSPHTLRHTGVTVALRAGEDAWKVAGVAALTMETMDRVYGHHTPEHGRSAVDKLAPKRSTG